MGDARALAHRHPARGRRNRTGGARHLRPHEVELQRVPPRERAAGDHRVLRCGRGDSRREPERSWEETELQVLHLTGRGDATLDAAPTSAPAQTRSGSPPEPRVHLPAPPMLVTLRSVALIEAKARRLLLNVRETGDEAEL